MIRIAESADFRDRLAAIIPQAVILQQFLRFGVTFHLERNYEQYLVLESDGLIITERGFVGVPSCLIWFHVEHRLDGDIILTLYDAAATRPPEEAEDES